MSKESFVQVCKDSFQEHGYEKDERYVTRFKWELQEIVLRQEWEYFWDLRQRNVKYPQNENNLLICFLLGIVSDFDVDKPPKCEYGEFPDIDVDYIPAVRDYLKNTWAPKNFGQEYVCNIGNYTTFGIKSALIDMVRVHGLDRNEILALTKDIELRDDEGKLITWDGAMKTYPKLKEFCEKNPEVAVSAEKLLNRNRGMGVHAGGLIISSMPLNDLVPCVKRKDNPQASAWPEGLHGQDLQPVGLVKFDLLVISNLLQIARCCEIVKQRHNIDGICNLPDNADWTDVPQWRNDKKSIEMANRGDLKCIFQFDSDGIRNLVRSGGVDSFEDLVAYTAIYRPGPLGQKMHERYIDRKKKREKYSLHPLMEPILGKTYGVLIYQEDLMKLLHVVGNIPLKDCEAVRKAISKKKIESFAKYKEMFLVNGKKNLNCSEEFIQKLYDQIEAFSEYGFNRCLSEFTLVKTPKGKKLLRNFVVGDEVCSIDKQGKEVIAKVKNVFDQGIKNVFEVIFDDFTTVRCTLNHKFLTEQGQKPLWFILKEDQPIFSVNRELKLHDARKSPNLDNFVRELNDFIDGNLVDDRRKSLFGDIQKEPDGDHVEIENLDFLESKKIIGISYFGKENCFDLEVDLSTHNFILENGLITSNSHAVAYTYISMWLLYLKAHYPHEFYTSILSCENLTDKIHQYRIEAKGHGVEISPIDINISKVNFELVGDAIFYGLSKIKGIGEEPAQKIVENQPYSSFEDFLVRFGTDASVLKPLIALRCFKDANPVVLWKYLQHFKDIVTKFENKKKRYLETMQKYEDLFKKLAPEEKRNLSDLSGDNPFDADEWKSQFDKDETIDTIKQVESDEEDGTIEQKISVIETDDEGVFIESQKSKTYKNVVVKKVFNRWKELKKIWSRRKLSISKFQEAEKFQFPTLADFDPSKIEIDDKTVDEFLDPVAAEKKYYGFPWTHPLENFEGFKGLTFEQLKFDDSIVSGPVEFLVNEVQQKKSKNDKIYFQITAEDCAGQINKINIWPDDFERWKEELSEGSALRASLQPPSGGFTTFLLQSNRVNQKNRWHEMKYNSKDDDPRIIVLKKPEKNEKIQEVTYLTDEEALQQIFDSLMGK